jgi:hypothetical protein
MAKLQKRRVISRESQICPYRLIPPVRHRRQARKQCLAQIGHQFRQRIAKVLAASEAMPRHHHAAAEQIVSRVTRR